MTAASLASYRIDQPVAASRPLLRGRMAQFAWFLAFALATRWFVLGDLNYQEDELLFFWFGQRMHEGLLPYVDLWDRKPPSLFLLYYLFAGISRSVYAYQLAALACVATTAQVIALLSERIGARGAGATLAGTAYLATVLAFGGAGGQAPVFYNLLTALAALLVFSSRDSLAQGKAPPGLFAAMLLAGVAITFKQTAFFEAAFLGCYALWQLARGGMARGRLLGTCLAMMLTGAAPMLGWALFYALAGHFDEFWHAMILSNVNKGYNLDGDMWNRAKVYGVEISPLLLIALAGLAWRDADDGSRAGRNFVTGWVIAAFTGYCIIPNFIDHYALPLLLPLAVAASLFLGRRPVGWIAGILIILLFAIGTHAFDFGRAARSRAQVLSLVQDMRARDPEMRLFVFDGPVYLNALTGSNPPTALSFPLHLAAKQERNVSHLDTAAEVRKVLAWRPTTLVLQRDSRGVDLVNAETAVLVMGYINSRCRTHYAHQVQDMYGFHMLDLYTDCIGKTGPAAAKPPAA